MRAPLIVWAAATQPGTSGTSTLYPVAVRRIMTKYSGRLRLAVLFSVFIVLFRHCRLTQYTPTVVAAAIARYGFTPLTPSHGYFSEGGSRSPSSRSWKRG